MEQWAVAAFIFGAIAVGIAGQAWVSWLDHQRRTKVLDVIKAAMEAGREPPAALYEQLEGNPNSSMGMSKRPWVEALVFAAVAIGFWVVFGNEPDGDQRQKYLLVASVMSVASIGCLLLAVFRPGQRPSDDPK